MLDLEIILEVIQTGGDDGKRDGYNTNDRRPIRETRWRSFGFSGTSPNRGRDGLWRLEKVNTVAEPRRRNFGGYPMKSRVAYLTDDPYIKVYRGRDYCTIKFLGLAWEIVEYDAGAWPEVLHV